MTAISDYLKRISALLASGDATEHSHRPALQTLIETLGEGLQVINEPRHVACGAPDFVVRRGQTPLGYIETKDIGVSLDRAERSEQMARYLDGLGNLVLTDYLEFRWYVAGELRLSARLATRDANDRLRRERNGARGVTELLRAFLDTQAPTVGTAQELARRMAGSARLIRDTIRAAFAAEEPEDAIASPLHAQYDGFKRVLLHDLTPEQFADMYAQTICYGLFSARCNVPHPPTPSPVTERGSKIAPEAHYPTPSNLGHVPEESLGGGASSPSPNLERGLEGEVSSPSPNLRRGPGSEPHSPSPSLERGLGGEVAFTREHAAYLLPKTNPFLREMFHNIAGLGLDPRLVWVVDDLAELLNRADITAILEDFGRRTRREDPVVHFYETFLAAYDPTMREARGVYYTPEPVVSYIVHSVDHLLRQAFGCPDGLADTSAVRVTNRDPYVTVRGTRRVRKTAESPRVLILDPACGTGTFLHAVVDRIHERMVERGQAGGWSSYVRDHLLPRLYGFELLMAPYAVAHMKLGLQLQELGYDFGADERLRIYLTNTLEEPHEWTGLPMFTQELAREVQAANQVKQDLPIMVVLGNPPYSGHSANKGPWIRNLLRGVDTLTDESTSNYFQVDGRPLGERNPKWLNDDYVKFIRFAQWRIERSGYGILAFISNHGYLDNPTFRGMRQSLMTTFDEIYLLDLHGNAKKLETCPDGSPDENVFDIQQGVAIGLFVKRGGEKVRGCAVRHADLWGTREVKYGWLWEHDLTTTEWETALPQKPFYLFVPQNTALLAEYERGWKVTEAMPVNSVGIVTGRDRFAVAFEPNALRNRILSFVNESIDDSQARARFLSKRDKLPVEKVRRTLREDPNALYAITNCLYRPFDVRPVFYHNAIIERTRRAVMNHLLAGDNVALITSRLTKGEVFKHAQVTRSIVEVICMSSKTSNNGFVFPLYLYPKEGTLPGMEDESGAAGGRRPNLAPAFVAALEGKLGLVFEPHPPTPSPVAERGSKIAPETHYPSSSNLEQVPEESLGGEPPSPSPSPQTGPGSEVPSPSASPERGPDAEPYSPSPNLERGPGGEVSSPSPDPERGSGGEVTEMRGRIPWEARISPEMWQMLKPLARQMRHEPTPAEALLWQAVRGRRLGGYKFRRQQAIARFIVDFYCPQAGLVVEVDGPIHEYTKEQDTIRQGFLESIGLSVLRVSNKDVLNDLDSVLAHISAALSNPPSPSPERDPDAQLYSPPPSLEMGPGGEVFSPSPSPASDPVAEVSSPSPNLERGLGGEVSSPSPNPQTGPGGEVFSPEDVFHYIYALLHSPTYRQRYAEFLKIDFPHIPLTSQVALFRALAGLGAQLVGLHLIESPEINNLVTRFPEAGDSLVERVRYVEPQGETPGRVYINKGQYFEGISPQVWALHIGGYQVLRKWLKDRRKRQLSFDDLLHYQKIVVALQETMRLMAEIDSIIDAHGGWPIG